jgi:hypothetical protein
MECEYCGLEIGDGDWGDVQGAIVCQHCIDNDTHVKAIVAEMERRLGCYWPSTQEDDNG